MLTAILLALLVGLNVGQFLWIARLTGDLEVERERRMLAEEDAA